MNSLSQVKSVELYGANSEVCNGETDLQWYPQPYISLEPNALYTALIYAWHGSGWERIGVKATDYKDLQRYIETGCRVTMVKPRIFKVMIDFAGV